MTLSRDDYHLTEERERERERGRKERTRSGHSTLQRRGREGERKEVNPVDDEERERWVRAVEERKNEERKEGSEEERKKEQVLFSP